MSATIIDLAARRHPDPRIAIYPCAEEVAVRLEPPSNRPGVRGGSFATVGEARRHALAMRILLRRRVVIIWGSHPDAPGGAAA